MARFWGEPEYRHGEAEKIGVLLTNLGTPQAPTTKAVRVYLREFLSDPKVVETPKWWWQILLNAVILPSRSPKTAAAYRQVWTDDGSPLMTISQAQRQAIEKAFTDQPVAVELGMSYGKPSLPDALRRLRGQNCRRLLILPLYPQYAGCTVGSVFSAVSAELSSWRWTPHFRFIGGYCDDARYIAALADSVAEFRQKNGDAELLLFSFHGTPVDMLKDGDPYHCFCHKTARLTAEKLNLKESQWQLTFQSRFGRAEWLKPYTIDIMRDLPKQGVKSVQVISPAFSVDCLETLEEIATENREVFLAAGGESYAYISALNDTPAHIDFLQALIRESVGDWLNTLHNQDATETAQRAEALKGKEA